MKDEAGFFKALAEPTRLRLAVLLSLRGETCVCMLAQALAEPEFKVSRHLGIMRSSGMVQARRNGAWMYYSLTKPRSAFEKNLQDCLHKCFAGHPTVEADLKRLSKAACTMKTRR